MEKMDMHMHMLLKYGTDITMLAEMGKLDSAIGIGREEEINGIIQVLLKRGKNNACLVGDVGVGKMAIVEALAIRIATNAVPHQLKVKKIFSIDMARIVAGAINWGEFEERMVSLVDEVRASEGRVILFIDELHSLITDADDRARENAPEAASILKPAILRGDFKCIAATTHEEYRRCTDKDATLKQVFQSIEVGEASRDESIALLHRQIHIYQTHHGVTYTHTALISAVDLSKRYIKETLLPEKAIDLIDEAGARAQLCGETQVTEADIERVVSKRTGIPLTRQVSRKESQYLVRLEQRMKSRVIGQDEAVALVSHAIMRGRLGIRDETKPIGSFLFTGPTGVGKTELAKVVADEYFGSREAMVRLDMTEFMEHSTVARLIGTYHDPDGQGGQLTEAVRRRPHSLVLFDHIDRAHHNVLNLLLQILGDGRLSDGKGRTVDFTNTIIILTAHVGTHLNAVMDAFKPELFNRFERIVVFKPLEPQHIQKILQILIQQLCARVAAKYKIRVKFTKSLKKYLVIAGHDDSLGARFIKRIFASFVETKLVEEILSGRLVQGDTAIMSIREIGIACRKR